MTKLHEAFDGKQSVGRKPGNTAWCQCPSCDGWFHLGPSILSHKSIHLHCPHCHAEFEIKNAKRLLFPDQTEKT